MAENLTEKFQTYRNKVIEVLGSSESKSLDEVNVGMRAYQLAYNLSAMHGPEISIDGLAAKRTSVNALALRDIDCSIKPSEEGAQDIRIAIRGYQKEDALFRQFFPQEQYPKLYERYSIESFDNLMKENTILYVHSRPPSEWINDKVKAEYIDLFGDKATLVFDSTNGLIFEKFLSAGKPIIYLTDWASTLSGAPSEPMKEIFEYVKTEHPQTKVLACNYMSYYEEFAKEGIIDHLLKASNVDLLPRSQEDIQLINNILKSPE